MEFVSARPKGRRAAFVLWAIVAVQIGVIVIDTAYLVLLGLWVMGLAVPEVAFVVYDYLGIGMDYLGMVLPVIAALLFLFWFQWVYRNLYALGARDLQYSTTWAVGSFFVPVSNLVLPYLVTKEIWSMSSVEPASARPAAIPAKLTWWWIAFLAMPVADYTVMRYGETLGEYVGEWVGFVLLDMGSALVTIVAAWLALWLIEEIDTMQEQKERGMVAMTAGHVQVGGAGSGANGV